MKSGDLSRRTILGFGQLIIILGLCLFVAAGTLRYWQGWLWLLTFVVSAALITLYLWEKDPELLERRVQAGPAAEKEKSQKRIQLLASVAFIGMIVLPALDHRFSWSDVPFYIVIAGDALVALGFLIVYSVFRENPFTAATIEVAADQRVISTGPYAIVRHPMYSGALVMLFGTPLALGSWWGLIMLVPMSGAIIWRLLQEERFLLENLQGYREYYQKVRFHLLPFVW